MIRGFAACGNGIDSPQIHTCFTFGWPENTSQIIFSFCEPLHTPPVGAGLAYPCKCITPPGNNGELP
jgi:hypothetical protein